MSHARRPLSRAARPSVIRLSVLTMVAAVLHMAGASSAGPPVPVEGHVAIAITGEPIVPGANNPTLIIEKGKPFQVVVSLAEDATGAPLTFNRDSVVTVSISGGAALGTIVVPAGASSSAPAALTVASAANGVALEAAVTGGAKDAKALTPGTSGSFDVLLETQRSDNGGVARLSTDRSTDTCTPDVATPYCADVSLPFGTTGGYLVSVGTCDGVCPGAAASRRVVQLLAGLAPRTDGAPAATIVFKCDKSKCKGGGVSSYAPLINLAPTGELEPAPRCNAKGSVAGNTHCVDYVQSKRDGAGDLHIYVLFAKDVRGSCC